MNTKASRYFGMTSKPKKLIQLERPRDRQLQLLKTVAVITP